MNEGRKENVPTIGKTPSGIKRQIEDMMYDIVSDNTKCFLHIFIFFVHLFLLPLKANYPNYLQ